MGTKKAKTTKKLSAKTTGFWQRHSKLKKWILGIIGSILLLVAAVYIAFQVSPWPESLLIRYEFDKNGEKTSQALEKYLPANVATIENEQYRPRDKDGYLDVFYPRSAAALPTVVWVHGGAWVSGDKNNIDNYLQILASYGFTTVGVDYTIAPEAQYPKPLLQLSDALNYLQKNAERLHIDPNNIVLAGDSAGSQIVAQMGTIITSPAYASEVGIQPTLPAERLKGMLLNCGAYDLALPDYNGTFGKFLHTVLWAYSGKKDFLADPALKQASVVNYVTSTFPPSFITAGNADPLEAQSTEFASKLASLNVPATTLFYEASHQPQLPHEYQFNLDTSDGKQALASIVKFLQTYAK
jgi:acetyl esterase/lipase